MKNLSLIIWLTQLGISVALPLGGFVWLGVWLHERWGWGVWTVVVGALLGIIFAADGLRTSLKAMNRMAKEKKEEAPPMAFNDHD